MKLMSYKFADYSELDIHEDMTATTVSGKNGNMAYELWKIASKDITLRSSHLYLLDQIVLTLTRTHNVLVERIDHVKIESDSLQLKLKINEN